MLALPQPEVWILSERAAASASRQVAGAKLAPLQDHTGRGSARGFPRRPECFRVKWMPLRLKKTRQNENPEPRSDRIGTEKSPAMRRMHRPLRIFQYTAAVPPPAPSDHCQHGFILSGADCIDGPRVGRPRTSDHPTALIGMSLRCASIQCSMASMHV